MSTIKQAAPVPVIDAFNERIKNIGVEISVVALAADMQAEALANKLAGHDELTPNETRDLCAVLSLSFLEVIENSRYRTMRVCTVEHCVKGTHEWINEEQDGPCEAKRYTSGLDNREAEYIVWVQQWPGDKWVTDGEVGGVCVGPNGLELIEAFRRDYVAGLELASQLNGTELRRDTEPGEPELNGIGGGL